MVFSKRERLKNKNRELTDQGKKKKRKHMGSYVVWCGVGEDGLTVSLQVIRSFILLN